MICLFNFIELSFFSIDLIQFCGRPATLHGDGWIFERNGERLSASRDQSAHLHAHPPVEAPLELALISY
jgi:hypothetical protein